MNVVIDRLNNATLTRLMASAHTANKPSRRGPMRSASRPASGNEHAVVIKPMVSANEPMPRATLNSSTTGLRKTPNVNCMIGPLPTVSAIAEPRTTSQGFLSTAIMGFST